MISTGIDSIKFSINGATRETYKQVHGSDHFEKVIENLKYLRKYRDDNNANTNIGASYVLTGTNRKEKLFAKKGTVASRAALIGPI